jgi:hypothetical protein
VCNGCGYQVPGFDSFRPGQVFSAEEFCKMLSEAEHNVCPTCGQKLPDGYTDDELFSLVDEDDGEED